MEDNEIDKPFYPATWIDDQKMDTFFAPFRVNRDVNPNSWVSKMNFWKKMIISELKHSKTAILDSRTIANLFKRKGKTPKCLSKVIAELVADATLKTKCDFESELNGGWLSWGVNVFVKKPVSWTFRTVTGSKGDTDIKEGLFVLTNLVEEMADAILDDHYKSVKNETLDNIIEYSALRKNCKSICPDEASFELSLQLLQKMGKVHRAPGQSSEKLVKFCKKGDARVLPISVSDKKTTSLKKTEAEIQLEVEKLYHDADECFLEAKNFIKKGQKSSARTALRRKKNLCLLIDKRETALANIQGMLQKIHDSESDKKILQSYEVGTGILKSARGDVSISKIDDTMSNLEEALEEQGDIAAIMSKTLANNLGDDISMSELEAELELLQYEGIDNKAADSSGIFPAVPDNQPGSMSRTLNTTYDFDDLEKEIQQDAQLAAV